MRTSPLRVNVFRATICAALTIAGAALCRDEPRRASMATVEPAPPVRVIVPMICAFAEYVADQFDWVLP